MWMAYYAGGKLLCRGRLTRLLVMRQGGKSVIFISNNSTKSRADYNQ